MFPTCVKTCLTLAAIGWMLVGDAVQAQPPQASPAASLRGRRGPIATDGPNPANDADRAAGRLIDSLFEPLPPADGLPQAASRVLGVSTSEAARGEPWSGRLARTPNPAEGRPPYVIIDHYGGIKRYVEPTTQIDLEPYVGRTVTVRRDTGETLLASQLLLPMLEPTPARAGVRLAQHQAAAEGGAELLPIPADEAEPMMIVPEGTEPVYLDEGIDFGVPRSRSGGANCFDPCGFGARPMVYVRAQYLAWWLDGMEIPPLVIADAVDDTFQNAEVIYGAEKILEDGRNGARIALGYWLDDYGQWAVEGDYSGLEVLREQFVAGALDGQIPAVSIGRPFINVFDADLDGDDTIDLPRGPAVEEVDTSNLDGSVTVDVDSEFQTAGVRFRHGLCCSAACGDDCDSCGVGVGCGTPVGLWGLWGPKVGVRRIDALLGVRWAQLDEGLVVTENLAVRQTAPATTFLLTDQFHTSNEFVGPEFGVVWEWEHRRWSVELLSKLAIGNTRQRVDIDGNTLRDRGQATQSTAEGGLLALPSNIGTYTRDQFGVMPELGVTVGYLLTERLRFSVGYTFIYWSNVVRPGGQIDPIIDVTQVPAFEAPNVPGSGPAVVPRFVFQETGLWAQGLDVGFDYRW